MTADPTRSFFDHSAISSHADSHKTEPESHVDVVTFKNDGFLSSDLDLTLSFSSPPSPSGLYTPVPSSENALNLNFLPSPSPSSSFFPSGSSPTSSTRELFSSTVNGRPTSSSGPESSSSGLRGSWPISKYVGRGTPIDRSRRNQWGGSQNESGVGEDGVLFSAPGRLRPSMESNSYPAYNRRRDSGSSTESGWHAVPGPRALSPLYLEAESSEHPGSLPVPIVPLPDSSKIQFQVDSDPTEWDSIMKSVLSSGDASAAAAATASSSSHAAALGNSIQRPHTTDPLSSPKGSASRRSSLPVPGIPQHPNGLDIVLGLDNALDLGLNRLGKMNFFDLGLMPSLNGCDGSVSGRDSPSVYSDAQEEIFSAPARTDDTHEFLQRVGGTRGEQGANGNGNNLAGVGAGDGHGHEVYVHKGTEIQEVSKRMSVETIKGTPSDKAQAAVGVGNEDMNGNGSVLQRSFAPNGGPARLHTLHENLDDDDDGSGTVELPSVTSRDHKLSRKSGRERDHWWNRVVTRRKGSDVRFEICMGAREWVGFVIRSLIPILFHFFPSCYTLLPGATSEWTDTSGALMAVLITTLLISWLAKRSGFSV
ncbi:hypothetical protein D9758_015937 [Tetrapyrgos nigripes]|uniref:Uncharacterized protein n=1 Tax=Tetrapyrgos nigripes TaxID=182062 RepID=A0A8H5C7D5_9AGAR|nr:hypothetical protein D9758_015937 [Tetrapyrgos nigripes]